MIVVPETPITEESFQKWKCHKIEFTDDITGDYFYCYVLPLIDVDIDELNEAPNSIPALWSSESTEFTDETGRVIYSVRLFNEDLPELTTEEEVEILYKLLTKREIYS